MAPYKLKAADTTVTKLFQENRKLKNHIAERAGMSMADTLGPRRFTDFDSSGTSTAETFSPSAGPPKEHHRRAVMRVMNGTKLELFQGKREVKSAGQVGAYSYTIASNEVELPPVDN